MEDEVKSWLQVVLDEKMEDFSVKILGNSEKGDGYLGDIVFVSATPIHGKFSKEYNLVLKCSKRSDVLRKTMPVSQAFLNEMYMYNTVLPTFTQFQLEKGISEPFNSAAKCYGTMVTKNMEIIVLENLKKCGYSLYGKRNPWTRKHINLVTKEYAKFHSTSIAMEDQEPKKFKEVCSGLNNVFEQFVETSDLSTLFEKSVEEVYQLLKDDLDENIMTLWRSLKDKIAYILGKMNQEDGVKVILHGDCWGNNFMFKENTSNGNSSLEVAILDWQIGRYASPILDLSYFLFAGISKEDINNIDDILDHYYSNLKTFTASLGSDLSVIYPKNEFLSDWKKYCKYGIILASLIHKVCATDTDEVIDIAHAAEIGGDFSTAFGYDVRNKTAFKNRARHVVKYVVENQLI